MIWRFAPSPTGSLHLGSLRIALLNYIQSHKVNGSSLILRIEDTDQVIIISNTQKRLVTGSSEKMASILEWLGIKFNNVYIQSERLHLYREKVQHLLGHDHAYKCFCSAAKLQKLRTNSIENKTQFKYDQSCRNLSQSQIDQNIKMGLKYVVRFKAPTTSHVEFKDLIYGNLKFNGSSIDDLILLKSDGWPTYHLASVIDDHEMNVDHVIRGQEWISSTPKHILLYKAFGWKAPNFAHLPLLLNKDGSKLSKRQNDLSIEYLKVITIQILIIGTRLLSRSINKFCCISRLG